MTKVTKGQAEWSKRMARVLDESVRGRGDYSTGGEPAPEDLAVRNADELFEPDYMRDVLRQTPAGADSPALNTAMERLTDPNLNPDDADGYLETLRQETKSKLSPAEFRAQYDKYRQVRASADQTRERKRDESGEDPGAVPNVKEDEHPNFMGSTASLRFGQVVGDHFGLDPVFGAMLSPTGGIVGPGNDEVFSGGGFLYHPDDPNDPIVKHGVMHDAAGYLYNYHDQGPGYDYLGEESDRDASDPEVGQESGVTYWLNESGRDDDHTNLLKGGAALFGTYVDAKEAANEAYEELKKSDEYRAVEDVYNWADETYEEANEAIGEAYDDLARTVEDAKNEAAEAADEAVEAVGEAYDDAYQCASETASDVLDSVGDAAGSATDAVGDAYDYANDGAAEVVDYFGSLL